MKNRILFLSLIIWVFCGVAASSFFSTKTVSSEEKTITNSLQNNPQVSSTTSYDSLNVYGSGTLTEDSPSGLSYRVTITVTSPSGRSNTTQSDWSPSPITHTTGLSISDEDGVYSVQTTFESQNGTYDDYKSFDGEGTPNVVDILTRSLDVPPQITLTNLIFTPPSIPAIAGNTSNAVATVIYSRSIPENTTVEMEINDGPIGVGNPLYNINTPTFDPTNGGIVLPNSGNREVKLTVPVAGATPRSVRVTFPFVLSQNTGSGTISANVRMGNVVPQPSPTIQISPPLGLTATLTVSPTPSPSPSPTPGGGGGGGGGTVGENCFCAGGNGLMSPGDGTCGGGGTGQCPQGSTGSNGVCCWYNSPIILDIDGDGFDLTSYQNGVNFDLSARGYATKTSWTRANSDDAWLVLDRNENNRIDSGLEMFGDACEQPAGQTPRNGFSALAVFDTPAEGGNSDGKITRRDAVFKKLRLWQDRNHNGISEAEELSRLPALDVVAIFLDYQESRRTDNHGNKFKYWARIRDRANARIGRKAFDVFLVISPPQN